MLRFDRIEELRSWLRSGDENGVGLVPTMGALHEGHLTLVDACSELCDRVVVSIFVNPLQFGPAEDFARYPRELESDLQKLHKRRVAAVFVPSAQELYPHGAGTVVQPGQAAMHWEGELRPSHFSGVLTVVAKHFNIVQPRVATFGQKDYQQAVLVRSMVRDLNLPVQVEVVPTVRDADGLALSSRNAYLSAAERGRALCIPAALNALFAEWRRGQESSSVLVSNARSSMASGGLDNLDYLAIVHPRTLEPLESASEGSVVLLAAPVGATRLLDNVILRRQ
jgi:pantoate--beta-alanine ligase